MLNQTKFRSLIYRQKTWLLTDWRNHSIYNYSKSSGDDGNKLTLLITFARVIVLELCGNSWNLMEMHRFSWWKHNCTNICRESWTYTCRLHPNHRVRKQKVHKLQSRWLWIIGLQPPKHWVKKWGESTPTLPILAVNLWVYVSPCISLRVCPSVYISQCILFCVCP